MSDDTIDDVLGPPPSTPEDDEIVAGAVRKFFEERHGPGDILEWAWLHNALGVPDLDKINDVASFKRWQLRFVVLKSKFSKVLLTAHNVAIDTVIGVGVRVVEPRAQTSWAQEEMGDEFRRTLSKGSARLRHVNLAMLTASEKAQNSDALAQFAGLRTMMRGQIRRLQQMNGSAKGGP
jgi:hypothetical protein